MIINQDSKWSYAEIFPWADTIEEAPRTKRITVTIEGQVQYDGHLWTRDEFVAYMGMLYRGFTEAFILAAEAQNELDRH